MRWTVIEDDSCISSQAAFKPDALKHMRSPWCICFGVSGTVRTSMPVSNLCPTRRSIALLILYMLVSLLLVLLLLQLLLLVALGDVAFVSPLHFRHFQTSHGSVALRDAAMMLRWCCVFERWKRQHWLTRSESWRSSSRKPKPPFTHLRVTRLQSVAVTAAHGPLSQKRQLMSAGWCPCFSQHLAGTGPTKNRPIATNYWSYLPPLWSDIHGLNPAQPL